MHRFFFAIIIESALSPIQKKKKRAGGVLLANPNSHTSPADPAPKSLFSRARNRPRSIAGLALAPAPTGQVEVFHSRARCRCARTYPGLARQTGKRYSKDFIEVTELPWTMFKKSSIYPIFLNFRRLVQEIDQKSKEKPEWTVAKFFPPAIY
jgi:hypothetical protein